MKCRRIRFSKNPFPSNQENALFISKEFCCPTLLDAAWVKSFGYFDCPWFLLHMVLSMGNLGFLFYRCTKEIKPKCNKQYSCLCFKHRFYL